MNTDTLENPFLQISHLLSKKAPNMRHACSTRVFFAIPTVHHSYCAFFLDVSQLTYGPLHDGLCQGRLSSRDCDCQKKAVQIDTQVYPFLHCAVSLSQEGIVRVILRLQRPEILPEIREERFIFVVKVIKENADVEIFVPGTVKLTQMVVRSLLCTYGVTTAV